MDSPLLICLFLSTLPFASTSKERCFRRDLLALSPKRSRLLIDAFENWRFSSFMLLNLPTESSVTTQRFTPRTIFCKSRPTSFKTTVKLAAASSNVLTTILDLNPKAAESEAFANFASGNRVLPDSVPLAHRYGGHQFGTWANQLGDGRAILLGEYINKAGDHWELQLKGSGKTPYSRAGDGRAVIRSSVREFLASEAMYYLGVPTSRAASLVVSNDVVYRDQFYDGRMKTERTAVVLRLSPSWFRFGSLEILAKNNEYSELKQLIDYIMQHHFHSYISRKEYTDDDYIAFYGIVVNQTADLIAFWQSVGFAHGVCNTDNFSILSLTIDYGPFGFLDTYNPNFIPNYSDDMGRYSYRNQPDIGYFNLDKLREAILPVLKSWSSKQLLSKELSRYWSRFQRSYLRQFSKKLGVRADHAESQKLVDTFLNILQESKSDFSASFRQLGLLELESGSVPEHAWALQKAAHHGKWSSFVDLYGRIIKKLKLSGEERIRLINATNPIYVLRNWMAEQAIKAAENDDFSEVEELSQILSRPFEEQSYAEDRGFSREAPKWSNHLKVSCSS